MIVALPLVVSGVEEARAPGGGATGARGRRDHGGSAMRDTHATDTVCALCGLDGFATQECPVLEWFGGE
jgi:hypothetical protein